MKPEIVRIGGRYLRIADARWADAVDPTHSAHAGGRWNPRGIACLYLNYDAQTVHANLQRKLGGRPYARFLDPATAPIIVEVELPDGTAFDAYTQPGITALGLPTTYPVDANGDTVPHRPCQAIGKAAFDLGFDGVDCKSAAADGHRELAWFPHDRRPRVAARHRLDEWNHMTTARRPAR